jgi:uncharacterized membrane protein
MMEQESDLSLALPAPDTQRVPNQKNRRVTVPHIASEFRGPLPPPEMLAKYERVFPGCAERIVAMTEQQGRHRRWTESTIVTASIDSEKRGSNYGLILASVALIGSFVLMGMGRTVPGLTVFFVDIAGIVGVFVYGRWIRRPDRDDAAENQDQDDKPDEPSSN